MLGMLVGVAKVTTSDDENLFAGTTHCCFYRDHSDVLGRFGADMLMWRLLRV